MKILLATSIVLMSLWTSRSVYANCVEIVSSPYGKDTWAWNYTKYEQVRKISEANKAGCNFNQKALCEGISIPISALSCASYLGDVEVAEELVKANADANSTDAAGKVPLFYAVQKGNVQIVRLLMKAGADYEKMKADYEKITKGSAKNKKNSSLYAIDVLVFKEKDNFNVCNFNYDEISSMFFVSQAMSNADDKDKKLRKFTRKLQGLSSSSNYNKAMSDCAYAKNNPPKKTGVGGTK